MDAKRKPLRRRAERLWPALLLVGLLLVVAAGCRRAGTSPDETDTPTTGTITIAADESFRPLVQAQVDVFNGLYKRARIDVRYVPEQEAVRDLLEGKVRLIVVSRELTEPEKAILQQQALVPRTAKMAVDGVALIVNRQNPDSLISILELRDIFAGKIRQWNQMGRGSGDIVIVFDNSGSSNFNYIESRFGVRDVSKLNVFAARSNQEVIDYVKTNRNAIGIIGTAWISDSDDPKQQRFLNSVRVVGVAEGTNPSEDEYFQPYQAYLSLKQYPLRRDVLILSREARAGLGTGFMSHVASERGQRIVLKSGLLPVTMPVRIVGLKETF